METVKNIVGLHTGSVYEDIQTYLGDYSKNTRKSYFRNIAEFFMWFCNKELNQLSREDLYVRNADIKRYRNYLMDLSRYSNQSINLKIASIQSLYHFLEINEYPVKHKLLSIKPLPDSSSRRGELYASEAEKMAQLVLKQRKGQEKSALIRMAYTTSFRKESLLSLEWSDIVPLSENGPYEVKVVGKGGKKHSVLITFGLYTELLKIKDQPYYAQYQDNKIFHLSNKTIQNMMQELIKEMGIPEERNIVFHSLRNVASMFGSLEEAKEHYNHSTIVTTNKSYRHRNKDLSKSLSLRIENKIEDDIFHKLSKEELIDLILKQNEGVKIQLKLEANNIIKERE